MKMWSLFLSTNVIPQNIGSTIMKQVAELNPPVFILEVTLSWSFRANEPRPKNCD